MFLTVYSTEATITAVSLFFVFRLCVQLQDTGLILGWSPYGVWTVRPPPPAVSHALPGLSVAIFLTGSGIYPSLRGGGGGPDCMRGIFRPLKTPSKI